MSAFVTALETYEKYKNQHAFLQNPAGLYEPMNYILSLGGKRIRPALSILVYNACKKTDDIIYPIAHAMELFHNFSLMHDDIMDNASIRRGKPSTHIAYDTNTAILSGDNLLIAAYQSILESKIEEKPKLKILELFTKTAKEICEGQQLDIDFSKVQHVSEAEYLEMIRLKTAVLLGCCAQSASIVAGMEEEIQYSFYNFAEKLGMAFQLHDDYLDTFGTESQIGKKVGGDILENKNTLLAIQAREKNPTEYQKNISIENEAEKILAVTNLFKSLQLDIHIMEETNTYYALANIELEKLKNNNIDVAILKPLLDLLAARQN